MSRDVRETAERRNHQRCVLGRLSRALDVDVRLNGNSMTTAVVDVADLEQLAERLRRAEQRLSEQPA